MAGETPANPATMAGLKAGAAPANPATMVGLRGALAAQESGDQHSLHL
jgi:hypothetical protein